MRLALSAALCIGLLYAGCVAPQEVSKRVSKEVSPQKQHELTGGFALYAMEKLGLQSSSEFVRLPGGYVTSSYGQEILEWTTGLMYNNNPTSLRRWAEIPVCHLEHIDHFQKDHVIVTTEAIYGAVTEVNSKIWPGIVLTILLAR